MWVQATHKGYPYINVVPGRGGTPEQETGGVEFHCHFRDHESYALVGGNWASKGNAFSGIFNGSPRYTTGNTGTQDVIERGGSNHAIITRFSQHASLRNRGIH